MCTWKEWIFCALAVRMFCHCHSVVQRCPALCDSMNCGMPGFSVHHYLHEFAQTHLHSVSDAIQPSHYLSPPSLSFIFSLASGSPFPMSQFFTSGGEYWRFSFSISPSNEYSGLISLTHGLFVLGKCYLVSKYLDIFQIPLCCYNFLGGYRIDFVWLEFL